MRGSDEVYEVYEVMDAARCSPPPLGGNPCTALVLCFVSWVEWVWLGCRTEPPREREGEGSGCRGLID